MLPSSTSEPAGNVLQSSTSPLHKARAAQQHKRPLWQRLQSSTSPPNATRSSFCHPASAVISRRLRKWHGYPCDDEATQKAPCSLDGKKRGSQINRDTPRSLWLPCQPDQIRRARFLGLTARERMLAYNRICQPCFVKDLLTCI